MLSSLKLLLHNRVMTYEALIDEFCMTVDDSTVYSSVRKRKSVLIGLLDDIDYNLGIYKRFKHLNLTEAQLGGIESMGSSFAVSLLFCSAVDLVARVARGSNPPSGKNGEWFQWSAVTFFGLSQEHAKELWGFRNSLSHSYSISGYTLALGGVSSDIYEKGVNGTKVFFTRRMRTSLGGAKVALRDYLLGPPNGGSEVVSRQAVTKYIETHGFSYYLYD